jgi:hypothetical protein
MPRMSLVISSSIAMLRRPDGSLTRRPRASLLDIVIAIPGVDGVGALTTSYGVVAVIAVDCVGTHHIGIDYILDYTNI